MNELNIYTHYNYKRMIKKANRCFSNIYTWYNPKTVFAPETGTFSISINRYSIRICYWDIHSVQGKREIENIKKFIEETFENQTIGIKYYGNYNILSDLKSVKTIQMR